MPALAELLAFRAGVALENVEEAAQLLEREVLDYVPALEKRINIPCTNNSCPPGLIEANTVDPWNKSGKYALGWVYFCIILLVLTSILRWYNFWNDKIRVAIHKQTIEEAINNTRSPDSDYELSALSTDKSTRKFFPREGPLVPEQSQQQGAPQIEDSSITSSRFLNVGMAAWRWVFYHPIPALRLRKRWRPIAFPGINVLVLVFAALAFVILYCFIPQPLYWSNILFGSPPLAIRAGMIAVAMMPWIVALSMKANFISMMTGIGHERLNVLHRWLAYLCLLLSLVHMIPFYITPVWTNGALAEFTAAIKKPGVYIYGTGISVSVLFPSRQQLIVYRFGRDRTPHVPLCPLHPATTPALLRVIRHRPHPGVRPIAGDALLALQQLPHILVLSLGHGSHLARIVCLALFLPQLD
jgi:hypothetical protein